jgi:nitrate reductase beta subunit
MLFYVPPMLPVLAKVKDGVYDNADAASVSLAPLMSSLERARLPLRYMASMFAAGNDEIVAASYRKLIAVRIYMRAKKVKDVPEAEVQEALKVGGTTAEEVEAIFQLTAKPTFEERFVIPPLAREVSIEQTLDPFNQKREGGFGFRKAPARGA